MHFRRVLAALLASVAALPAKAAPKQLAGLLAKAIREGRTNPGPARSNDGKPIAFPERVTALLPELGK